MSTAFAINFRDLETWAPGAYTRVEWDWKPDELSPLSEALVRRREPVDKDDDAEAGMVSLSFDGDFTARDIPVDEIDGKLFAAWPGDVVYSKIDVRHGAIGVLPARFGKAAVTAEFPVYSIREDSALPEYVALLFRSRRFREVLASKISGASGRKRIDPERLESTLVPLRSTDWQRSVVAAWSQSHEGVVAARMAVKQARDALDQMLEAACEPRALTAIRSRALVASAATASRWDVAHEKAGRYRANQPNLVYIGELAEPAALAVKPSAEPDHAWPVYGVDNKVGVFLSHYQPGSDFKSAYKRIRPGWFFHNPTRSSVGSLGRVPLDAPEDAITSPEYQVWRAKSEADAAFIEALLGTRFFLRLVNLHRSGGVKQRLYVQDLLSIGIPPLRAEDRAEAAVKYREARDSLSAAVARHEAQSALIDQIIDGSSPMSLLGGQHDEERRAGDSSGIRAV